MTGVITYMIAFDRLPELDRQGRPKMFYSQRLHDKCYRRPHFDAGQFVERFDDEGARKGYCLYKVGCKGPTTYNACASIRWDAGLSFPVQSGHPCLGCSQPDFWDGGGFYQGQSAPLDRPAVTVAGAAAAVGVVAGLGLGAANRSQKKRAAQAGEQKKE
jgi:hydrogenase small subunit